MALQVRAMFAQFAPRIYVSDFQYYDFFQTIELEVEYIWKARFNLLKFTYLFMKYLPYVDVPLLACTCFLFDVEKS